MTKKLTLSIANPCHEDWDKMSDDAKGKFCGACQKEVIDFTNMSESQLVAFFKKPAGSVCGRFRVEQLDQQMNIPKKRIPWIRYFFTIALPAFLFSLKSNGQNTGSIKTDTVFTPKQPKRLMLGKVSRLPEEIAVRGKVVDENGNVIPFATVMVKDSEIGVAADENGFFSFKAALKFPFTLTASSVGYETTEIRKTSVESSEITMKQTKSLDELVIISKNQIMLGGISSSVYVEKQTITKADVKNEKEGGIPAGKLLVYPNPVRRGNNFTIAPEKLERGQYKVTISDLSGKTIQSREVIVQDGSAFSFNINEVAKGSYVVNFISRKTNEIITEKIILK